MVSLSHLATEFLLTAVFDDQAPRTVSSHGSPWLCTVQYRPSAVSRYTQSRSSVNRVYNKIQRYAEDNRTESNCIRTSKCKAEVTNNKKLRSRYYTIEANYTDRHEASCGLFATAELLVFIWKQNISTDGHLGRGSEFGKIIGGANFLTVLHSIMVYHVCMYVCSNCGYICLILEIGLRPSKQASLFAQLINIDIISMNNVHGQAARKAHKATLLAALQKKI